MIRVALDTNIIVSALLQPLGPPAQVFMLALGGSIQLCAIVTPRSLLDRCAFSGVIPTFADLKGRASRILHTFGR